MRERNLLITDRYFDGSAVFWRPDSNNGVRDPGPSTFIRGYFRSKCYAGLHVDAVTQRRAEQEGTSKLEVHVGDGLRFESQWLREASEKRPRSHRGPELEQ